MNALYLAAVALGLLWLTRRKPQDARQVSSAWMREQIRTRGKRGYDAHADGR